MEDKRKSKAVWGAAPAGALYGGGAKPGTKEYFQNVLKKRNSYELPWLFELIPFSSFRGKTVLELGCGAGYDAYEFCKNGAIYTGIDITPENIQRTIKHLQYYGYNPEVIEGDVEDLKFDDESYDIVFANGVLHHTPNIRRSFREAHRVLKNDGVFWIIVYHKHSIFYWLSLFLIDHIMCLGFMKRSFRERLAMIEYTTSNELPLVNVYSRKTVRKMLKSSGFRVDSLWVRKLVKEDLPFVPVIGRLWKFVPQFYLDRLGKYFGWYIIAKATKSS